MFENNEIGKKNRFMFLIDMKLISKLLEIFELQLMVSILIFDFSFFEQKSKLNSINSPVHSTSKIVNMFDGHIYRLPPLPPTSPALDASMIRCDFVDFHKYGVPWISGHGCLEW